MTPVPNRLRFALPLATGATLLSLAAACASTGGARGVSTVAASATMVDTTGAPVGTATLRREGAGVRVEMEVRGLPAGEHGVHLHAVGRCDMPSFTSAGGHFNPGGAQHGTRNPAGPHAGDLPDATGGATTTYSATTTRVTLDEGTTSVFDADGTAIVIHASGDDDVTDPSGNSGARIACGVFERR